MEDSVYYPHPPDNILCQTFRDAVYDCGNVDESDSTLLMSGLSCNHHVYITNAILHDILELDSLVVLGLRF